MPALLIFGKKYSIIIIEKVRKEFSNDFGSAESSGSHFRVLLELGFLQVLSNGSILSENAM